MALVLTFDGGQNAHIMELDFYCLKFPWDPSIIIGKLKSFSVRFQMVSMVVPFVDLWVWEPETSTLWLSVE